MSGHIQVKKVSFSFLFGRDYDEEEEGRFSLALFFLLREREEGSGLFFF